MLHIQRKHIKNNIDTLAGQNKTLDYNAALMNTIVSSEVAINHMVQLKELIKSNSTSFSVNRLLILGAEFEMISDYIKNITRELDLQNKGN